MKSLRLCGLVLAIVLLVTGVVACASQPAPAPKASAVEAAAVVAIPNVGTPGAKVLIVGANFKPKETVKVVYNVLAGEVIVEIVVGEGAHAVAVNEAGSFRIDTVLPPDPGVFPIKVFDKQGKQIAVTAVAVAPPPKK